MRHYEGIGNLRNSESTRAVTDCVMKVLGVTSNRRLLPLSTYINRNTSTCGLGLRCW